MVLSDSVCNATRVPAGTPHSRKVPLSPTGVCSHATRPGGAAPPVRAVSRAESAHSATTRNPAGIVAAVPARTRPTTNPDTSADPHAADSTAASDGMCSASGGVFSVRVTAVRDTAPMESSHGVLTSTVYSPRESPPTVNAPDESVAPSKGVPRNVTRASATTAPVTESVTVPDTTTDAPVADGRLAAVATGASVGSGTFTMDSRSSTTRCTRTASLSSRHAATSMDVARSRPRHSVTSPLDPVMPPSDTTRQRDPSATLTRHLAPDTGRPLLSTTRARSHESFAWACARSHIVPTNSSAVGTSTRTRADDERRAVSVRVVGIWSPSGVSRGSSTTKAYGPGRMCWMVARPLASVVAR